MSGAGSAFPPLAIIAIISVSAVASGAVCVPHIFFPTSVGRRSSGYKNEKIARGRRKLQGSHILIRFTFDLMAAKR